MWGSGCIDPRFLDLSTSWRWVVSFMPQPLYPPGKEPPYPLDNRLGGPLASLDDVHKRKFLTLPGLKLWPLGCQAHSQSLYQLCYPGHALFNNNIQKYVNPPVTDVIFLQTRVLFPDMGVCISYTHFHNTSFLCNAMFLMAKITFLVNF
jgi:hypothetical protein